MTAKVAGVVRQKFVHLAAWDADLMKIVWVVTDYAFILFIALVAAFKVTIVLIVMFAIVVTLMTRG